MANRGDLRAYLKQVLPDDPGLESLPLGGLDTEGLESIGGGPPPVVATAVSHLRDDADFTPEDEFALEAIVLPRLRPVIDIVDGTYVAPTDLFVELGDAPARDRIEAAIPSVGRIELPTMPSIPYGGTGFVVGEGLMLTNRHVAELFADGLGRRELSFKPGHTASVDFLRERDRATSATFGVERVLASTRSTSCASATERRRPPSASNGCWPSTRTGTWRCCASPATTRSSIRR